MGEGCEEVDACVCVEYVIITTTDDGWCVIYLAYTYIFFLLSCTTILPTCTFMGVGGCMRRRKVYYHQMALDRRVWRRALLGLVYTIIGDVMIAFKP